MVSIEATHNAPSCAAQPQRQPDDAKSAAHLHGVGRPGGWSRGQLSHGRSPSGGKGDNGLWIGLPGGFGGIVCGARDERVGPLPPGSRILHISNACASRALSRRGELLCIVCSGSRMPADYSSWAQGLADLLTIPISAFATVRRRTYAPLASPGGHKSDVNGIEAARADLADPNSVRKYLADRADETTTTRWARVRPSETSKEVDTVRQADLTTRMPCHKTTVAAPSVVDLAIYLLF